MVLSIKRFGVFLLAGGALLDTELVPAPLVRGGLVGSPRASVLRPVRADVQLTASQVSDVQRAKSVGPATFPLAAVVGQESIKTALTLAAVNPSGVGGVVIAGGRGTAKSVLARGVHELLPPIEVVKGSKYNVDPAGDLDSQLAAELEASGKTVLDLETEVIPTPFVQIPLDVLEDRLLGSVDLESSVAGTTIFEPGILASAHRGLLYVDDINLLDESISNLLLEALSAGFVTVEREGLSVRYPFQPLLVATFNPEEAELRPHLQDRIGISLSADVEPLEQSGRLDAVQNALDFAQDPQAFRAQYAEAMGQAQTEVLLAREYLKETKLKTEQIKYLVESAIRAGVQGNRGELFAVEAARASAALRAEPVLGEDLELAVKMCIVPRGTVIQSPQDEQPGPPPPAPPPPPSPEDQDDKQEEKEEEEEEEEEQEEDQAPAEVPQEFLFDVEGVAISPDLMQFANKGRQGRSGKRGVIFSEDRGRYIKPMLPKGKVRKLAVDATLRTAAPYQKSRRARYAEKGEGTSGRIFVEREDMRSKKMARKSGSLVVFVVDASGSMALNRMNAAKGAAVSLLGEAYQSRDKISLITFAGDCAEVILPPTRSIAMAKNRLERMPCGGGSPLAHALSTAAQVGLNAQQSGDVGEVVVVLISDGRGNIPLAKSIGTAGEDDPAPDKDELKEEAMNTAKQLGALRGFKLLVIDTENKFVSTGVAKELAVASQGKYYNIPKAGDQAVANVASSAIAEMKQR